jgi:phosphatidylglycerol---prolipoprotein diacylglyceryl transferase
MSVTWYGLCVAAGFWVGTWTAARRAPKAGVAPDVVWDFLWVLILAGIAGARALYVATYWERDFQGQPWSEIFMVHHGGLVFHGGFVGATLAGFAWCAWRGWPAWTLADILAPSLAIGHAIGRIGCLLNGCCYGRRCDLPWAWRYPASHDTLGVPIHPTQLYEAGLCLLLAGGLAWGFRRRQFEGQIFAVYLAAYGILRSVVELFRGDYPPQALTGQVLTPAHWVSLGLVVAGLVLYAMRRRIPVRPVTPGGASGESDETRQPDPAA